MLKADIGDILYIVIFAVMMLAGGIEKYLKAKRRQEEVRTPHSPQSHHEEEERPVPRQGSPQTIEEMLKRMLQPTEIREEADDYPEEAQSLEVVSEVPVANYHHQPVHNRMNAMITPSEKEAFAAPVLEEKTEVSKLHEYEFDLRQAIISSEILNRKYSV